MQTSSPPFNVQESHTHIREAKESEEQHGVKRHANLSNVAFANIQRIVTKVQRKAID